MILRLASAGLIDPVAPASHRMRLPCCSRSLRFPAVMAALAAPPAAAAGAAVLPAPDPAAVAAHDLWLNREYARQAARNRERGIHTHVQTIKFKPTAAALASATAHARGKADPVGSPSTQLRIDRAQWDRPLDDYGSGLDHSARSGSDQSTSDDDDAPGETKEEEFEPVRGLDEEEEAEAAAHGGLERRLQQQPHQRRTKRRHRTAGHQRFDDEEDESSAQSGDAAAAAAVACLLEHCAGSLPAIVIDPSSSLINGWPGLAKPHLVLDVAPAIARGGGGGSAAAASAAAAAAASSSIPAHVLARAHRAPVPSIWTTDYNKHSIRCILADGQVHTVAGGGAMAADPVAAAAAAQAAAASAAASSKQHHSAAESSSASAASAAAAAPISGFADGTGTASALFRKPRGLCIHPLSGEVFIADSANHCIRRIVAPAVVGRAVKRAVKQIEAESSFRRLRDPTADPVEEERAANAAAAAAAASASSPSSSSSLASRSPLFPSALLSASLTLVCDLFLPLLLDLVGFEVTTVAGIPGVSGLRDTGLGVSGRVEKQALFKFPIGMCLRIVGDVEADEDELAFGSSDQEPSAKGPSSQGRAHQKAKAAAPPSLSSTSVLSASTSYELLVSDAGNGCIRRIKPNPFFAASSAAAMRAQSPSSPLRLPSSLQLQQQQQQQHDRGFIVDTIEAFVPVRCCHTSWNSAPQPSASKSGGDGDAPQQQQPQQQQHEEEKESASSASSSPPPPAESSSSSFGSSLLSTLEDPSRLLSGGSSAQRETLLFQYPIGIALRLNEGQAGLRQVQAEYGTIWTVDPAPTTATSSKAESEASDSSADAEDALASRPRRHAAASDLIVVDARASCVYSLALTSGRVRRLAGSSDGGWGHRDGWASRARFCRPSGVAVDPKSGDIFVADAGNSCVRKMEGTGSSCRVSTLAGHPRRTGHTDGAAFVASLYAPLALALVPCPFYPGEHPDAILVAGGFRQGLRRIVRCECRWKYEL